MPTIQQGFARILQYGNPKHKEIIRNIQSSAMRLLITNLGSASGVCGVEFPVSTQRIIYSGPMSEIRSLGELWLQVDQVTAQTYSGLEGTLIHETRHAYHMARAISEISHGKKNYYNPNGFEIEYSANVAYVEYVKQAVRLNHPDKQVFINEAINVLKIAKQIGNNIVIDELGVRNRLNNPPYKVNDTTNKGATFSDHWKIYPKISVSGGLSGKVGI